MLWILARCAVGSWHELLKTNFADMTVASPWTKKFAWLPVTIQGKRVWFKPYYARIVTKGFTPIGNIERKREYGTIFDVLKEE